MLQKKLNYFQDKVKILGELVDADWLNIKLLSKEELEKLVFSTKEEDIKQFIDYLWALEKRFCLSNGRRDWLTNEPHCISGKRRWHTWEALKSLLRFAYCETQASFYYQKAIYSCGGSDYFIVDLLNVIKSCERLAKNAPFATNERLYA